MTKVYKVTAKVSTLYVAYVQVSDDMTADDLTEWYKYNGSGGEFSEVYESGDWDWQYIKPELTDYDGYPDMVFF